MPWYAPDPVRRTRQIVADIAVLGWVLAWVLIGRWIFDLVMALATPAAPLRSAGTGMEARMEEIAGRVTEIPLVGNELSNPFAGVAGVGTDLVSAGDRLEAAVRTVAQVVSVVAAGTPILLVVLAWAGLRVAWVLRARRIGPDLEDPRSQQLLALRSLVRQSPRRLQRVHPDPVAAWHSNDPEAIRALADLELAQLGLRRRG